MVECSISKDGWKKRMDFLGMAPFVTIQNKRPRPGWAGWAGREHNAVYS